MLLAELRGALLVRDGLVADNRPPGHVGPLDRVVRLAEVVVGHEDAAQQRNECDAERSDEERADRRDVCYLSAVRSPQR